MIKLCCTKIIISAILIEFVYILNYFNILKKYKEEYPDKMLSVDKNVKFGDLNELLWGQMFKLMNDEDYWKVNVTSNQAFI